MAPKKLRMLVSLVLALLLVAPAMAFGAVPVRGTWKGNETHWWNGAHWRAYSRSDRTHFRVSFTVQSGKVASVKFTSYPYRCAATGERIRIKPAFKRAKIYRSGGKWRFRTKSVTRVAGKTYRADVTGTFSSSRRVGGRLKSALSGCGNSDRTKWNASRPKPKPPDNDGHIHPGICIPYVLPSGTTVGCWI